MKTELSPHQEQLLAEALAEAMRHGPQPPADLPETLRAALTRSRQRELPEPRRTLGLIAAQAPVALRGRLLPALALFVGFVFLTAAWAASDYDLLVLMAALPAVMAVFLALLSGPRIDPAHVLVASTRTSFGAVVFARTTLVLAVTVAFGLVASTALALMADRSLAALVTAWLGPTLLIAALATLMAQRWRLTTTVIVVLLLWSGVVGWVYLELTNRLALTLGTSVLLRPGAYALAAQLLLAALLLLFTWRLANADSGRHIAA